MNLPATPAPTTVAMVWRFCNAALDESRMELSLDGAPVALERKPLEVLRQLLRHAGEVVTKDELQEAVWPGRVLSETVLTKAISRIREVLGEPGAAAIKTVHGYGYRLVAAVSVSAPAQRPQPRLELQAGQRPKDRPNWQLDRHLDSGGRGELWRARHDKTGELRVFKFALDAEGLAGLKREITLHRLFGSELGAAAAMLPVLDFNLEEAPFFLELPYVAGGDLRAWLAARGGIATVPLAERLALFIRIAQAVAQAHAVGVLHKDLKPANILIDSDGQGAPLPLLADFGSAGVMSDHVLEEAGITRLGFTQVDASGGATPLYLAPEVLRGELHTTRSDLYALGVMLYQLVVGDLQRPIAPGWEADVPDELLREDIAAAVQGDPQRRLTAVAELAQRLEALEPRRVARAAEQAQEQQAREAEARAAAAQREAERLQLRRTWMGVTAGVFLLGAVIATGLAVRARAAAHEAQAANASTQATMHFLVEDVLGAVSLRHGPAKQMTLNQIIERAARKVDERFPATDYASRVQTYRALYEVYGVTDYGTLDPRFNDWLHSQLLANLEPWFSKAPEAAFGQAYQSVMEADFWNNDPALLQLVARVNDYAQASGAAVPVSRQLALRASAAEALIKQGQWQRAAADMRELMQTLQARLPQQLAEEPYALITALNNANRLGLHRPAAALCTALMAQEQTPAMAGNSELLLEVLESCAVSAAYRADSTQVVALANRGLALARANYDELVGYVPTFKRYLSTALADQGALVQALVVADDAVSLRRARGDELLPYVLTNRGLLLEAGGQDEKALADYREASAKLAGGIYPLLAVETHARLTRALARAGDAAGAHEAYARIAASAPMELPSDHRSRALLLQAQGWIAKLEGRGAEATQALRQADAILAGIGYGSGHFLRLQLAEDLAAASGA